MTWIGRGAMPSSSARNWPQAAAIETPRDQRTVVAIPASRRIVAKRSIALLLGGWNGPAAGGVAGDQVDVAEESLQLRRQNRRQRGRVVHVADQDVLESDPAMRRVDVTMARTEQFIDPTSAC